jgi:hypothetical protein
VRLGVIPGLGLTLAPVAADVICGVPPPVILHETTETFTLADRLIVHVSLLPPSNTRLNIADVSSAPSGLADDTSCDQPVLGVMVAAPLVLTRWIIRSPVVEPDGLFNARLDDDAEVLVVVVLAASTGAAIGQIRSK